MNFFKSILADDPEPENSDNHEESEADHSSNQSPHRQQMERAEDHDPNSNPTSPGGGGGGGGGGLWSFGDLVKTLTSRSESVLETYRRDLKEFGTGLRKESDLFREVASRAVKELPSSIEVGASAIDGVLKSTADIIAQGKDAILAPTDDESDSSETRKHINRSSLSPKMYSRFDTQLNAIQSDKRTYCEEPEDVDDYDKWKSGFVLSDRSNEIENLGIGREIHEKIVPNEVDDDTFWCRYLYRVHKLKQQEDVRAKLVKRSLSVDEEELSWDVDDEEEEQEKHEIKDNQVKPKTSTGKELPEIELKESSNVESKSESPKKAAAVHGGVKNNVAVNGSDEKVESLPKTVENVDQSENIDRSGAEEDDLEWDEIEDLGNDEKEVSRGDDSNKAELRKRLSAAEDDEDLNWDIEEDDEPVKAGVTS